MFAKRSVVLSGLMAVLMLSAVALAAKTEVCLWHHWDRNREDMVQNMLDRFMAENPDVEATQMMTPPASRADKLITLLISGSAPEIVMVRSSYAFQIIKMGFLMPLDEHLTKDRISVTGFIPADLRPFQRDGKTYGLPVMSGAAWTNLMFYNKRLLLESGLPADVPRTWAEWREMSLRVTKRDAEDRLITAGTEIPSCVDASYWNGASLWSDDWKRATIVSNGRLAESATFLMELHDKQFLSRSEYFSFMTGGIDDAFYLDRVGFAIRNSSTFNHLRTTEVDWGAGLAPRSGLHDDAVPMGLVLSTWAYSIPAQLSPAKFEATWRLFKWLTVEEDAAGWFTRIQGRPSPIMRFNQHRDYRQTNPYWEVVIRSTEYTALAPPVNLSGVTTALFTFLNGSLSLPQAMANAELDLQNQLDSYWAQ